MIRFRSPEESLGPLDASTAAALVNASADIALVLDGEGVIRDLALGREDLDVAGSEAWVGQAMADTVTVESRPKVAEMIGESAPGRLRHVNHRTPSGDLPVLYSAVPLGHGRGLLALGRDMRRTAELQQRLVDAQHQVEREYAKLRNIETRYRLLLQTSGDAVAIVEPDTGSVVEANPATAHLLGVREGQALADGFAADAGAVVEGLLARARATGAADEARVRTAGGDDEVAVSAHLFREGGTALALVRVGPGRAAQLDERSSRVLDVFEASPDGIVVTDADGRILVVNDAFLELAQVPGAEQAAGQSLERWLGRPGVDLSVLLANLREHGVVRLFATRLRGEQGVEEEVEISAVRTGRTPGPCMGFVVRSVGRRPGGRAASAPPRGLPSSTEQLTELVGRVPLKDLVRQTTDLIERLCIEAALEMTGDNRASAAEMLGLSRQSLYVKLHRYGVIDGEPGGVD